MANKKPAPFRAGLRLAGIPSLRWHYPDQVQKGHSAGSRILSPLHRTPLERLQCTTDLIRASAPRNGMTQSKEGIEASQVGQRMGSANSSTAFRHKANVT